MSEHQRYQNVGQPYVAVKAQVTMQTISAIADRIAEVFAGWRTRVGSTRRSRTT
jgi:hypothetical protein